MAQQAELMKAGTIFVTFTKGLPSKKFELIERKRYRMSWGPATVFIQRRLQDDSRAPPLAPYKLNILPCDEIEYSEDMDNDYNSSSNSISSVPVGGGNTTAVHGAVNGSGSGGAGAGLASVMSSATYSLMDEDDDDEFGDDEDSMRAVIHPSTSQLYKRLLHQQQAQQRPSSAPSGQRISSARIAAPANTSSMSVSSTPARSGKSKHMISSF